MTRRQRIALELLGPAPTGALIWVVAGGARTIWIKPEDWALVVSGVAGLPLLILFAYFFAGIPSLGYAAILEWSFARGLKPHSWFAVVLSTALGLASGAGIVAAYGFDRSDLRQLWEMFGGLGVSVGLVLGLVIKFNSKAQVPA